MVKRLDVCRIEGRSPFRFAIILQADEFSFLHSRLVAPVVAPEGRLLLEGIHPEIDVDDFAYIVRLDQIAAMPVDRLGETVASVSDEDYTIQKALDRLFASA